MRNELLSGEVLDTLEATKVIVETWPRVYNRIRPYNSFGKRPPEPKAHVVGKFTLGLAPCYGAGHSRSHILTGVI